MVSADKTPLAEKAAPVIPQVLQTGMPGNFAGWGNSGIVTDAPGTLFWSVAGTCESSVA
jgi:hypothetical protein